MKTIIIINGKGGCGKDTLCDIAATKYNTMNVSSITPIKEMAKIVGWNGAKTDADRKFLSDLKEIVTRYNDGANEYIIQEALVFSKSESDVMFIHIREPENIEHFIETARCRIPDDIQILTLLVKRDSQKYLIFGNKSDDDVELYDYDFIYSNSHPIEEVESDFLPFLENMLKSGKNEKADICASKNSTCNNAIVVKNNTNKTWKNCYLRVIVNENNAGPECTNQIANDIFGYPIPELNPGEEATINVEFNTGNNSGTFNCCFIAVDKNLNCISIENVYAINIKIV